MKIKLSSQELEIKRYNSEKLKWVRRKERWNKWKTNKTKTPNA